MRRKWLSLSLALCLLFLLVPVPASAETEYLSMRCTAQLLSTSVDGNNVQLSGTLAVVNAPEGAFVADVQLYAGQSGRIVQYDSLAAGQSVSFTAYVRSDDAGSLAVNLYYTAPDGGPRYSLTSVDIQPPSQPLFDVGLVDFTVTPSSVSVTAGTSVTFVYSVVNHSSQTIHNLHVTDTLTGTVASGVTLPAGQSYFKEVAVAVARDVTSRAAISFAVSDSYSDYTIDHDPVKITVSSVQLSVLLTCDAAELSPGQSATLTCTLKNEGKTPLTNVVVSEDSIGTIAPAAVLKAGESFVCTKNITPAGTTAYIFLVTAVDASGNALSVRSNAVTVEVLSGGAQGHLVMEVTPNLTQLSEPGTVSFDILVRNRGGAALKDFSLSEANAGLIASLDTLPTGDKSFTYTASVSRTTEFAFTASGDTAGGERATATSDTIQIALAPSPSPSATVAPSSSNALAAITNLNISRYLVTALVVVGLLIVLCLVALVALSARERRLKEAREEEPYPEASPPPAASDQTARYYAPPDRPDAPRAPSWQTSFPPQRPLPPSPAPSAPSEEGEEDDPTVFLDYHGGETPPEIDPEKDE